MIRVTLVVHPAEAKERSVEMTGFWSDPNMSFPVFARFLGSAV